MRVFLPLVTFRALDSLQAYLRDASRAVRKYHAFDALCLVIEDLQEHALWYNATTLDEAIGELILTFTRAARDPPPLFPPRMPSPSLSAR